MRSFAYKTLDTAVLGWLVERVASETISAYMTRKIWEPIGAEADGFFSWTCRLEWGASSQGPAQRGTPRLCALRPDGFERRRSQRAPHRFHCLVEGSHNLYVPGERPDGLTDTSGWTFANSHAFTALGLQGQYIFVDPSTKTVIVKVSYFPPTVPVPGERRLPS